MEYMEWTLAYCDVYLYLPSLLGYVRIFNSADIMHAYYGVVEEREEPECMYSMPCIAK